MSDSIIYLDMFPQKEAAKTAACCQGQLPVHTAGSVIWLCCYCEET